VYYLRTLSLYDVLHALQNREPRLALRIGSNLCSNALSTVRADLRRHSDALSRAMGKRS
jgi:hypothetical protein